ncbi:DUF4838 domain-containing protein [Anatilimnocola aggregata]|nr:DUF4838 domain-containing protein [Anatilimnocola aggregata]
MTSLSTMLAFFLGGHLAALSVDAAEPSLLYGKQLTVPQTMRPELKAAVDDLRVTLKQMTGSDFSSSADGPPAGIILMKADDPQVPSDAIKLLPPDSREACVFWPDGETKLWIISRSDNGLSHAVYLYLEQLGCRWYFPAEHWKIIPQRNDIRIRKPFAIKPAFRSRVFAGSGGFGGNLPLDPKRQLQARWTEWQRRNRFGGEFRVAGHSGEAFNLKHRKELEAHPEWRAMVNGERVPWSLISKFCVGNQDVVDLFVKDRVDDYRLRQKRDPADPHSWAVSVEPADGGGHCTAPESLAIGNTSDRVFHVANQVARAVRKEFPDGKVSLFAYHEHAAVPSIPLEPNVYVQVIPYAFQRTGLTPDQLLDAWSQKVSRMGIYDYWSIPDWSHDLPTFDPLEFGPDRMRGWHRRGVDSFLCESTFSSGAMGPAWYIGSRLSWQPDTDVDALFEEFLRDSFGPAAPPMRQMLTRWSKGFHLTSHELGLSFRDIQDAAKLAERDPAGAARVADYGRYVVYLRLYFEHQLAPRGSAEQRVAAERLMRYMWSIYDSSMIHAFRLSQLLARDERLAGNVELAKTFDWQDQAAPGWKTVQRTTDEQIKKMVDEGVADFQPQDIVGRRFQGPLVRLSTTPAQIKPDSPEPVLFLNNTLEFQLLTNSRDFVFRPRIATELPVQFLITAPDGKQVTAQSIVTGAEWRTEWSTTEVNLPLAGLYRVQIISQKRPFRFSVPADTPLTMSGWTNSQGTPTPKLYFFVPTETTRLAIYTNYIPAGPPRFFDPAGVEVKPDLIDKGHLLILPVPAEHRGKVWSLDRAKSPISPLVMLNAPAAFAFSPEMLSVPQGALPSPKP